MIVVSTTCIEAACGQRWESTLAELDDAVDDDDAREIAGHHLIDAGWLPEGDGFLCVGCSARRLARLVPDDLTPVLGVVGSDRNPRMTRILPGRWRNRRRCLVCKDRKASHAGIDATSGVALVQGCRPCMEMWVIDPDFVHVAGREISAELRPRPHVCPGCGKQCTTRGHLGTHLRWCRETGGLAQPVAGRQLGDRRQDGRA